MKALKCLLYVVAGWLVLVGLLAWIFVVEGLVLAVLVPSVTSVAVTVAVPAELSVTLNVAVPATKAASGGKVALESLDVMPTV